MILFRQIPEVLQLPLEDTVLSASLICNIEEAMNDERIENGAVLLEGLQSLYF